MDRFLPSAVTAPGVRRAIPQRWARSQRTRMAAFASLLAAGLSVLATAAAAQPVVPSGDSYLCYKAGLAPGQAKFTASQKTLADQFGTRVVDVKGIAALCNPTETAAHPAVHAVGYKIGPAKEPPQTTFVKTDHTAFDQFGTHPLTVLKPIEIRAPSAQVPGAGGTGPVDTTGVDHFECYKAKPAKGAPKFVPPAPWSITDELGTQSYTLKKITKLCTPVNKNGEDASAPQHAGHLVCYQAKLPAGAKFTPQTVSVNNANFGPAVLLAKAVLEVCVPAFKDTVPTPTQTITPTVTATPIATATPTTCSVAQPCPGGVECCSGTCLPPDAFCRRVCSVTTSKQCVVDTDCRYPACSACASDAPNQTCGLQIVPNRCGFGTCLVNDETCCGGRSCCRNFDQVCDGLGSGQCLTVCPIDTTPCADRCCPAGQGCVSGTCKITCASTFCNPDTETCCGDRCCAMGTVCNVSGGVSRCDPPATCSATEVYIPSTDFCCPQQRACGTTACCNLITSQCDAATGQCVPIP